MEAEVNRSISILDQVKIQAQVLVPLLRELRRELGREWADRIVYAALRDWSRKLFLDIGGNLPGSPREKWQAMFLETAERVGSDVDSEMLRQDDGAIDFNVTGCRYAEFFQRLGEPELGAILLCEMDDHQAEVGGSEVEFARTQTIMKGAKYCDFRYRMKKAADG